MTVAWRDLALEQLDFYWGAWRPRLDGLTDAEYLWEPVSHAWSVRAADGGHVIEYVHPEPDPPPLTTIAWRLCHIAGGCLGMRASNHFGDGSWDDHGYPATADAGLAFLDEQYALWRNGIGELDEAGLATAVGPAEGPYAEHPYATLVLHISREVMHHGGEVALMRDLYRASAGGTRWLDPETSPEKAAAAT
jgi:hypothetical protein